MKMNIDQLFAAFDWEAIPNCPGRYALRVGKGERAPGLDEFFDCLSAKRLVISACIDPVWVRVFPEGGGLISYERENRDPLHTLNTEEGFRRKLDQLGIGEGDLGESACDDG